MLHFSGIFPTKMLGSPQKDTKMLNNSHHREAFFKLILSVLMGFSTEALKGHRC